MPVRKKASGDGASAIWCAEDPFDETAFRTLLLWMQRDGEPFRTDPAGKVQRGKAKLQKVYDVLGEREYAKGTRWRFPSQEELETTLQSGEMDPDGSATTVMCISLRPLERHGIVPVLVPHFRFRAAPVDGNHGAAIFPEVRLRV